MKLQRMSVCHAVAFSAIKSEFQYSTSRIILQGDNELKLNGEDFTRKLLDRRWALPSPDAKIHQVTVSDKRLRGEISFVNNSYPSLGDNMKDDKDDAPSFYVVRDDLLHPLVNGNKARKLDGLLPLVEDSLVTDVVWCNLGITVNRCGYDYPLSPQPHACRHLFLKLFMNRNGAYETRLHVAAAKVHTQQLLVGNSMLQLLDGVSPNFSTYSLVALSLVKWTISIKLLNHDSSKCAAVACAERGLKSHLLLRGEQPEILTGYNLISTMYGNVSYVPRSLYARREEMLHRHADLVAGSGGCVVWFSDILVTSFLAEAYDKPNLKQTNVNTINGDFPRKVVVVNEGAGDTAALLGVIRLVQYMSQQHLLGKERAIEIVVDAGTGTTAVGLGLGAMILGLPWKVTAIMLADTIDGYRKQEIRLVNDFKRYCSYNLADHVLHKMDGGFVHWVERTQPRKFGNILKGEIDVCQKITQQTGILVDPVYTLSAWELATFLSQNSSEDAKVVMIHTGGMLGMFGLWISTKIQILLQCN